MGIKAIGKFFTWEDTLFYPDWEDDRGEYSRILAHKVSPSTRYKAPTSKPEKDFSHSTGIYLLHSDDGEIVYVGQAKKLLPRISTHTGDHLRDRWSKYSWYSFDEGLDAEIASKNPKDTVENEEVSNLHETLTLDMLEAVLRTTLEPRLNLQGGRWGNINFYAQSAEYEFAYLRENYEELLKLNKKLKKVLKKVSKI